MFTTTVADGIQFSYQDVKSANGQDSSITLVMLHGHTYHSGVFMNFSSLAASRSPRTILVHRRGYPGSTPYTTDERRILTSGTFDERSKLFDKEGEYLAMFLHNIIQEHELQKVVVVGWSLGVAFVSMIVDSIKRLDERYKEKLQEHICSFVYLDTPANCIGVDMPEGASVPLYDESLPPEERAAAFGKWVASYFPHEDITNRDFSKLAMKGDTPTNPLAFANLPLETLTTMADFTAGDRGDSPYGATYMKAAQRDRTVKALLEPNVRELWKNTRFYCVCGERCSWNVIWGTWCLGDMLKDADNERLTMTFKYMKGANHFTMYDNPGLLLDTLQCCINWSG